MELRERVDRFDLGDGAGDDVRAAPARRDRVDRDAGAAVAPLRRDRVERVDTDGSLSSCADGSAAVSVAVRRERAECGGFRSAFCAGLLDLAERELGVERSITGISSFVTASMDVRATETSRCLAVAAFFFAVRFFPFLFLRASAFFAKRGAGELDPWTTATASAICWGSSAATASRMAEKGVVTGAGGGALAAF